MKQQLRHGFTTGACAAAAARGAVLMLAGQEIVTEVSIDLPGGVSATFQLHGQKYSSGEASCYVIKDAGDDPDVTNGAEVHASVTRLPPPLTGGDISITGGTGIGKVTKPGLAIPPGEWAINPVPRRMIEEAVRTAFPAFNLQPSTFNLNIVISIPDGAQRAKKTLNQRLGIIGGLSILGTTGIVRPISAKAWTDTIDAALDVARACGCGTVVLSTGRTSEMAAQKYFNLQPSAFNLSEESFIMMGDHLAYALRACAMRGFMRPIIACQFAKMLKIACGHENTHASASELDLAALGKWAIEAGFAPEIISLIGRANTAREIAVSSGFDAGLMKLVASRAEQSAALHAPGISAVTLLCGYDGAVACSANTR